ncbi:hypothetical protein GP486_002417 [Trichoglossum hirsutum]|uniref:ELMO domain-containing protein n=1 Tax=Trichoglossum hirsutum TaxID=265104 RepID=A0A9P8LEB2_9PEZI|nr:hypothetical protein GP486_002417 [Trichoglossum hirsutum]
MENINVSELVERLGSDEDAVRKMAVFKLQSNIGDPSFAEVFIANGGLNRLRFLTLNASGNTLAYSLTSFSRLLEVDKGWDCVNQDLIARVVELVVTHPLVNILRGAMSILVAIVSHPQLTPRQTSQPAVFGFRALKPAIATHPKFLEMLVSRLSSADHALCANALQLINSLMRDAMTNDAENEWPRFIKRLQDLGVIKAVYILMQSSALHDLAHPILEFQGLTKVLLRKWREVKVDLEKPEHRRALKGIHLASNPDRPERTENSTGRAEDVRKSRRHNPEKWRRLGFQTESPAWEFNEAGFLGLMDLTDFVRRHEDGFQKLLLEQSAKPAEQRCPIARASLAVTSILYEHFEVGSTDTEEAKSYLALDSRVNFDNLFKPLLLQWSRLHTAGLQALFRMWKATGAELDDFGKVVELVKILIEQVVGQAPRTKDVSEVEEEITEFDYTRLREMQMELVEEAYEGVWGAHLGQVREELRHEALQFVKEQRIRCLLQGAWFPDALGYKQENGPVTKHDLKRSVPSSWRYVRLSHNRRYLHYADFEVQGNYEPGLDMLPEKVDLSIVSSVVSNVSATSLSSNSSTETLTPLPARLSTTKITIHGYLPHSSSADSSQENTERILLTLNPQSHSLASEWLDGLLMLLNQQPITAETTKLINLVSGYGLKIRLLNVRFEDHMNGQPEMPGREGLDEDYYYEVFGGL